MDNLSSFCLFYIGIWPVYVTLCRVPGKISSCIMYYRLYIAPVLILFGMDHYLERSAITQFCIQRVYKHTNEMQSNTYTTFHKSDKSSLTEHNTMHWQLYWAHLQLIKQKKPTLNGNIPLLKKWMHSCISFELKKNKKHFKSKPPQTLTTTIYTIN